MSNSAKTRNRIKTARGTIGQRDGRTVSRRRLVRRALVSLAAGAMVLGSNADSALAGTVAAPGCSRFGCDGRDPVQTGCTAGAYTAATGYAYRSGQSMFGDNGIIIELRYSPRCGTNWTRLLFTGSGAPWVGVDLEVIRSNGAGIYGSKTGEQWSYSGRTQTLWGNMIYAPSPTCAQGAASVDGWSYSWLGSTPWAC